MSHKHRELLVGEHVEPGENPLGRQDRLARQSILEHRPVSGRPARGTGIGHDGRLEELGAGHRREPRPQSLDL